MKPVDCPGTALNRQPGSTRKDTTLPERDLSRPMNRRRCPTTTVGQTYNTNQSSIGGPSEPNEIRTAVQKCAPTKVTDFCRYISLKNPSNPHWLGPSPCPPHLVDKTVVDYSVRPGRLHTSHPHLQRQASRMETWKQRGQKGREEYARLPQRVWYRRA